MSVGGCASIGTGFALTTNAALLNSVSNAPWGTLVQAPLDQMQGAAFSVVNYVAGLAGLNLQ